MQTKRVWLKKRVKSFRYAFAGISKIISTEPNTSIHISATIIVLAMAIFFKITLLELSMVVFAIALVWVGEMVNTCLEKILDFVSLENHPEIEFIKDVAAGAVLVASMTATLIGLLIFMPKILIWWK